ncbi:MAG: 4-hydroxy-tetrahydrodipicolinate synthase [Micropruina sp.]|uniref:4-hydroxy-tetrahydrodipicolinate synthase n=1 Tax=Micropruina sp. TaxID=2737536 RepID=UPI0039E5219E
MSQPRFGRLLTAMVTPFTADGVIDLAEARKLAAHLVDQQHNDALVINGTTGESPTTTDAEKAELVATVVDEIGDRALVVAGVGSNDTRHTIELARQAAEAGASGLLVVTPYYSKPPQDAVAAHFRAVADATELPMMLYDIPHRAGVPIETETLIAVASHPRIVAVKDAKGNPVASAAVIAATGLDYYAGDDGYTLPLLAVGGVGVVGTSTHFTGARTKVMIERFLSGDLAGAIADNAALLPVFTGVFATQGCMLVKAGLAARGFTPAVLRAPLLPASEAQAAAFVALLDAAGL